MYDLIIHSTDFGSSENVIFFMIYLISMKERKYFSLTKFLKFSNHFCFKEHRSEAYLWKVPLINVLKNVCVKNGNSPLVF